MADDTLLNELVSLWEQRQREGVPASPEELCAGHTLGPIPEVLFRKIDIKEFELPHPGSAPRIITIGSDGNFWSTSSGSPKRRGTRLRI